MFGKFSTCGRCCVENTSPKRIFSIFALQYTGQEKTSKKSNKNKNILINNKKYLYFRKYYDILSPTTIGGGIVMNWNKDKSVKLSKFCVCLFMLILAGVCIGAPWLFRLLIRLRVQDLAGNSSCSSSAPIRRPCPPLRHCTACGVAAQHQRGRGFYPGERLHPAPVVLVLHRGRAGMSVQCAVLYAVPHRQRGCGICWPDFARGEECLCRAVGSKMKTTIRLRKDVPKCPLW